MAATAQTPQERLEARRTRWNEALRSVPVNPMPELNRTRDQALAHLSLQPGWQDLKDAIAKAAMPLPMDVTNPNLSVQIAMDRARLELAGYIIRVVETAAARVSAAAQAKE